jgi:hypothetical protein
MIPMDYSMNRTNRNTGAQYPAPNHQPHQQQQRHVQQPYTTTYYHYPPQPHPSPPQPTYNYHPHPHPHLNMMMPVTTSQPYLAPPTQQYQMHPQRDPPAMKSSGLVEGIELSQRQLELLARHNKHHHQQVHEQHRNVEPFRTRSNLLVETENENKGRHTRRSKDPPPETDVSLSQHHTAHGENQQQRMKSAQNATLSPRDKQILAKKEEEESQKALLRTMLKRNTNAAAAHASVEPPEKALLKKVFSSQKSSDVAAAAKDQFRKKHREVVRNQNINNKVAGSIPHNDVKKSQISAATLEASATMSIDENYFQFVHTLQNEAPGLHSLLWKSFAETGGRDGLELSSSQEVAKLDTRILSEMNTYLRKSYEASVECMNKAQLLNDKRFLRGKKKGPRTVGDSDVNRQSENKIHQHNNTNQCLSPRKNNLSDNASLSTGPVAGKDQNPLSLQTCRSESTTSGANSDPILHTRSQSSVSDQSSSTRDLFRHSLRVTIPLPPLDSNIENEPSTSSSSRTKETFPSSREKVESKNEARTSPVKLQQYAPQRESISAPKLPSATKVHHYVPPSESTAAPKSSPEWKSLQLRSVSNKTETASGESKDMEEKRAPWLRVSLKPVQKTPKLGTGIESKIPMNESTTEDTTSSATISDQSTAEGSTSTENQTLSTECTNSDEDTKKPLSQEQSVQSIRTTGNHDSKPDQVPGHSLESEMRPDPAEVIHVDSDIEVLSQKSKFSTVSVDGDVIIPLKDDSSGHSESCVVVSKTMLMKITNGPGDSNIDWKLPRMDVEPDGMTLDMPSMQVTLILIPGKGSRKVLDFENAEDCLRFATAFYSMSKITSMTLPMQPIISVTSFPNIEGGESVSDGNSSVRLESLNDEEQTLLEKYRELRRNKDARQALNETMKLHVSDSSVSGRQKNSLDNEEEKIAEKFRKMIELKMPIGAVQHRMRLEGVPSKIIASVLSEMDQCPLPPAFVAAVELPSSPVSTFTATTVNDGKSTCTTEKLSDQEEKLVKEYKLLLKRGLPADSVRHKLTRDQVDMKIVAAVFAEDETNDKSASEDGKAAKMDLTEEDNAIAEKYRKMLKLKIPEGAVRHKMTQDQVDPKIVSAVFGDQPSDTNHEAEIQVIRKKRNEQEILSEEEESIASQYRKLLKLQVSKEAVLARMEKEGVSVKVISNVLGRSAIALKANQESRVSGSASNSSNLINLHWNAMDDVPAGSVWEASKNATNSERSDFAELVKLFQKKKPNNKQNDRQKGAESDGSGKAKLLDHTRATNISISLKAFKKFSHSELAEIIAFLDPTRKIRGERAQFIRDLLPTATEMKIIEDYTGTDDRLVPAEIWFRHLRGVKRLETKAQVMRTMEMFASEMAAVQSNYQLLEGVCHQVMNSSKLQEVLAMVLRIGNVMNEGTRTGGAAGFKFDSLLRLTQTKTADGKITVLDYLVKIFVERGQRDSLDLLSDFPDCQVASRMLISDMNEEITNLRKSLNHCRTELTDLQKDNSKPQESSSSIDPRSELFSSIRARKQQITPSSESRSNQQGFTQRDLFLAAIKEKSCDQIISSKDLLKKSDCNPDNSLASGLKRLSDFIADVEPAFSMLEKHRDEALEACKSLSKYCGESGGTSSTIPLLDILAQFAANLQEALKKHDVQEKHVTKKQKHLETKVGQSDITTNSCRQPATDGRSIVLLVNDVLQNANPRFKEDFKKGRCLENPTETLKAIYDHEKTCLSVQSSLNAQGPPIKAKDIVSAITARGGNEDDEIMIQDARSRFAGKKCGQTQVFEMSEASAISVKDRASQLEKVPSSLTKEKIDADESDRLKNNTNDTNNEIITAVANDSGIERDSIHICDSNEAEHTVSCDDQSDSEPLPQPLKKDASKTDMVKHPTSCYDKTIENSVTSFLNELSGINQIGKEFVPNVVSPKILVSDHPADCRQELNGGIISKPVQSEYHSKDFQEEIASIVSENSAFSVQELKPNEAVVNKFDQLTSFEVKEQEVKKCNDISDTAHILAETENAIDEQFPASQYHEQMISSNEQCLESLAVNSMHSETTNVVTTTPNQAFSSERAPSSLSSNRSDSYTEVLKTLEEMKRALKNQDKQSSPPLETLFSQQSPKTDSESKRLSLSERARLKRLEKINDASTMQKSLLPTPTRLSTGSANMSPISKERMSLSKLARLKRQKRLSS